MRTNTKAKKATTKSGANSASIHTTRVCITTAEKIGHLAESHNHPPALIAGGLAEIGMDLLGDGGSARTAGTTFEDLIMQVIRRDVRFPKPKCVIPILTTEWADENSRRWAKDMGCTLDEWLRCMVEIGVSHYHKPDLLQNLLPSAEEAYFLTLSARIKEDNEGNLEADVMLKPTPKAPGAFISFERILAASKGADT